MIFSADNKESIYDIFELSSGESANSEMVQIYEYYRDNPVDLRYASINDLTVLPFINYELSRSIIVKYQQEKPNNLTTFINSIKLDKQRQKILTECLVISKTKKLSIDLRTRTINDIQEVRGFSEDIYKGDRLDLFNRLRASYNEFELNLATNKNAGEVDLVTTNRRSLAYLHPKTRAIIGDFKIKRGLGLGLNTGFANRKSPDVISGFNNYGEGVLPNRSTFEFSGFYGLAAQRSFKIDKYKFTPLVFYSNKSRPANLSDNAVSSFYTSGYFRTENEIAKQNNVRENIFGASVELSYLQNFTIGSISYSYSYNKTLNTSSNGFFRGKNGFINSIYFYKYFTKLILAGEYVNDANNRSGLVLSLNGSKKKLNYTIGLRYFENGLRLQYSNVISEYSNLNNEMGFYVGLQIRKNNYSNSTYLDLFSRINGEDLEFSYSGYEFLNDSQIKLNKNLINLRFRHELKNSMSKNENGTSYIELDRSRTSLRGELTTKLKPIDLRLRTEIAYIDFYDDYNHELGLLSFIEFNFKMYKKLKTGFRYTFYNTDSFESAIWHFEYLTPGFLSAPGLNGEGNKILAFLKLDLKDIDIIIRYVNERRNSVENLGSSYQELPSNRSDRFIIQLDYKFRD